jgi:hypothetical protein
MKKVLAVVIAVAFISLGAVSSNAQVPNFQVYFDDLLQDTQGFCSPDMFFVQDTIYVVLNNFNTFVSTVDFSLDFTSNFPLSYLGDVPDADAIDLGTSSIADDALGITRTWPIPQNAFDPMIALEVRVLWQCEDCDAEAIPPQAIIVLGNEQFSPYAVEWQTFRLIPGVGMTSLVCPGEISTQESSWGQIKALYNN